MKKVLLFSAAVCFAIGAQAQTQVHFAPEIGLNVGNIHGKLGNTEVNYKGAKLGVKAGVNADIMIGNNFAVQPGLFYSIKGGKQDIKPDANSRFQHNFTLHYFEVPVNFQWYFNDPGEGRFFVGIGGYLGVPFSGKDKYNIHMEGQPDIDDTKKLRFGASPDENEWERWDAGVSANAGYYLRSGIFFRAMVQRGLMNNVPDGNSENSLKLNTYSVSIGYMIGGKR